MDKKLKKKMIMLRNHIINSYIKDTLSIKEPKHINTDTYVNILNKLDIFNLKKNDNTIIVNITNAYVHNYNVRDYIKEQIIEYLMRVSLGYSYTKTTNGNGYDFIIEIKRGFVYVYITFKQYSYKFKVTKYDMYYCLHYTIRNYVEFINNKNYRYIDISMYYQKALFIISTIQSLSLTDYIYEFDMKNPYKFFIELYKVYVKTYNSNDYIYHMKLYNVFELLPKSIRYKVLKY